MASISPPMQINDPAAYRRCSELEVIEDLLSVHGSRVLELGCGAAWTTRELVTRLGAYQVTATEVDAIQHAKNLALADLPAVDFRAGGAESIADPDGSYDRVFMFKSLHHVPIELMDQALGEIHRVLTPGGLLYVSEPVYWGDFNEIMRLIHDEREVRTAAFAALGRAIDAGLFRLEREVFYESEGVYPDWDSFAARFIQITHRERDLEATRLAAIRVAFERHLTPDGARFFKPHRVDLLRRR
ncbi:class I SAM-dependent methyltransferase [uncultured Thiocystis sp.]|jgi:SAM-dependent methyltransferase|uniref:class I SAM-dependent methyltransferase n=1 Tax=uncultured Thiocystis sp. TaxID=1202134 RepID=UPI0025F34850|nr:class I SAM-dependent methyltransferase [uncultured Thiocystis sp.]